ncbi:transposase [Azoarcus sp. CIB]|nr:transposase [Azoarcus sp. CIB]
MMHRLQFSRHTTASAPEFPAPRAAGCCSMPYRQHSPPQARVIVAPMTAVGVDLCVADGSMRQSSVILGTPPGVKSP